MGMTYVEKIEKARKKGIEIPDNILEENFVGLYKFFRTKDNEEAYCFYIGKSTNIAHRLLDSSRGHIYMYLNNNLTYIVPKEIDKYLQEGYRVKVEIIEINYYDKEFTYAAHRLALAELSEIVKYQEQGQCKLQVPEGVGKYEEEFWNGKYKIQS